MNLLIDPNSQNSQNSNSGSNKKNQTLLQESSFNSSDKLRFTEFTQTQHDNAKEQKQFKVQKQMHEQFDSQTVVVNKAGPVTASPAQVGDQKKVSKEHIINEVMERLRHVQDQQKGGSNYEEEQRSMIENVIIAMQGQKQTKQDSLKIGNMSMEESGS